MLIISKINAERVAKILQQLINHDQTCNIPSRKIKYNISLNLPSGPNSPNGSILQNPFLTTTYQPDALRQPHRKPHGYFRSLTKCFWILGDVCYQFHAGFHKPTEMIELIGYQGVTRFVQSLIDSLNPPPPHWLQAILAGSSHMRQTDNISLRLMCTVAALCAPSPLSPLRTSTPLLLRRLSSRYKWNMTSMSGRFITRCCRLGQINWRKTFLFMYRYHMDKRITDIQYKNIHGKIALRLTMFRPGIQDSCYVPAAILLLRNSFIFLWIVFYRAIHN